ncbi:MAG: hypothetical protein PHS64_02110 [Candidatus Omnitrophica bacterium]|nr:hypothetical protein [Candidatus Omnitrophota bacterium]
MDQNIEFTLNHIFYFSESDDFLAFAQENTTKDDIILIVLGSGERIYVLSSGSSAWGTLKNNEVFRVVQIMSTAVINGLEIKEIDGKIESIIQDISLTDL